MSVVAPACTIPPDGSTRWSEHKLAKVPVHGRSTVQKILSEAVIKPHQTTYWCGKSADPEFEEKQEAIVGFCMNSPENALLLSVDEKSQIHALDRIQSAFHETRRKSKANGSVHMAAVAVHGGAVSGRCVDIATHEKFLLFLIQLYRKNPGSHLHVIVNNLVVHKHQKIKDWVAGKRPSPNLAQEFFGTVGLGGGKR